MGTVVAVCPNVEVDCDDGYFPLNYDHFTTPLSITSCMLSCIGSIAIVFTFLRWKDVRSGLRWVIVYLAIADFFTAAGYLMGSFNYLSFKSEYSREGLKVACTRFDCICQIQAFVSSWSSMCSFIWTIVLAFYLFWTIVKKEVKTVNCLFPLYHLLAWGLPVVIMLPLLVTSKLGYSPIAASGWCFIRADTPTISGGVPNKLSLTAIGLIFAGGKAIEITTYVIVIGLYFGIYCNIRREKKLLEAARVQHTVGINKMLQKVETKLYAIPAVFIVLRIWGTLQFFVSIVVFTIEEYNRNGCVSHGWNIVYMLLAVGQAIGDGGQGWANAILYILCSPKILKKFFCNPLCCCLEQNCRGASRPVDTVTWTRQNSSSLTVMTSDASHNDVTSGNSAHIQTIEQQEGDPLLEQHSQ